VVRSHHRGPRPKGAAAHPARRVRVDVHREDSRAELALRWRGSATTELVVELRGAHQPANRTDEDTIELIRRLAVHDPDATIAGILNRQRRRSATGQRFTATIVQGLRHHWGIPRCQPPAEPPDGELVTVTDAATILGVVASTVHRWIADGFIAGEQLTPGAPWRIRMTDELRNRFVDDTPPGWLAMLEATHALGASRQTVLQRVKRGELEAVHVRTGRRNSTVCEVEGKQKQGAVFGDTKVLGYHPILASRADTGEVLHARMRKGSANTARGARRFIDELIARVRRAGAIGEIVVRLDSGFWSAETINALGRVDVRYTMAVRTNTKGVARAIAAIDEGDWRAIDYTPDGVAHVAETVYKGRRLIVRRTRLTDLRQLRLWPNWRHFAFLTDLDDDAAAVDAFHRQHAVVELDIRDLKEGAGLEHVPSGNFSANSAWLQCARAGSQPHPLDSDDRPRGDRRRARRGPHLPHPPHRHARPSRRPRRHPDPARRAQLAVGALVLPAARRPPRHPARPRVRRARGWRTQTTTERRQPSRPRTFSTSASTFAPKPDTAAPRVTTTDTAVMQTASSDANRWIEAN
jgi:hypothetical protein